MVASLALGVAVTGTTLAASGDSIAPKVSFANLVNGQTLIGQYKITAIASDNRAIKEVKFYVNSTLKHTEIYSPYDFLLNTTALKDGNYGIKAVATDTSGNAAQTGVVIAVDNVKEPINTTGGYYDNFEGSAYCLKTDGATSPDGKWKSGYVSNGSACIVTDTANATNHVFVTAPQLDVLRSIRIDSTQSWNDIHAKMTVRLDKQLSGVSWYTIWPLIGYVDETNHYYFNLKTSGWELGKKDNNLDPSLELQRYLVEGTTPKAVIGQKYDIECWITLGVAPNGVKSNHLVVNVNNVKVADIWDDGTHSDSAGIINPTGVKLQGLKKVVLYNEASQVSWDNISIDNGTAVIVKPPVTNIDKFGVKELYPTATGGNQWYVNMADPNSDTSFRNLPTITKQADGSFQVSASQVRMEAWSPTSHKWLNVEITEYSKVIGGTNTLLQMYSRGGHHTATNPCLGSAMKGRFYPDHSAIVKEVTHPAYTSNRNTLTTGLPTAYNMAHWQGYKEVIYNVVENGKTYVKVETYVDANAQDSSGNLQIKNNWVKVGEYVDRGGWSTSDADFDATCFPTNKDSTQLYRQRDEILNTGGGTSTQNIAAWRSDDLTWDWKYLSVREITP